MGLTDGDRDADEFAVLQHPAGVGHKVTEYYPQRHCEEDPDGKEAVEEAESLERRQFVCRRTT